jgi:hypothetical protein
MRLTYTRWVTAPDGTEMIVRAERSEDANMAGEVTSWLPWPIFLVGLLIHEASTRDKYEGAWEVQVERRWGFGQPLVLGEFSKREALDLVDTRAEEIARGLDA